MTDTTDGFYGSVLVLRCQTGDKAAFEELVSLYQSRLRYFLQKMVRDANGVDDLLQDVWCDVLQGVSRLADPRAFRAWLYQVARHRAFRELRKEGHLPCSLDGIDLSASDTEDDFSAEDAQRVHVALDRITVEHREVLLLRFIHEMSYEEIARVIACQLGTVRSRLHYAKRELRHALERMNDHE
jgi:RNA polymerase sigma-70 factor (ECF subfamily)